MGKRLKKFCVAAAFLFFGVAIDMTTPIDVVAYASYTLAGLFGAIAAMSIVYDKWPWMAEWMPIPSSWILGDRLDNEDLRSQFIRGKTFHLWEVATNGRVLRRTFEDCTILGPVIMVPTGSGLFLRDTVWISRDGRDYFYELELSPRGGGKIKEGLLLVEECSFHRCRFDGVGIAGTADERCKYPLPPAEPAQAAQAR